LVRPTFVVRLRFSQTVLEDPTLHPAFNADDPHPILQLYDQRIYTNCLDRTFNHLEYVYTAIGQLIRDMNSVIGIPYGDYAVLIRSTRSCKCCLNHFSPEGYEAHRRDGRCMNHPDLQTSECAVAICVCVSLNTHSIVVEECEAFDGEGVIRFRSYRDDKQPEFAGETIDTPVGAALLEWNSRLGLPCDVWMMVSTAIIHCTSCDLVRSFPAHTLHLDASGSCTDPGQALIAPAAD
jgi:hypothetical protein